MWKATIRGLLARKVRLALTALSVLLGVSFVAGTYVLTDTLDQSFQTFFRETVQGIDVVVRPRARRSAVTASAIVSPRRRSVPSARCRVSGRRTASSRTTRSSSAATVSRSRTAAHRRSASPGHSAPLATRPLRLVDGRRPTADDEVAMDVGTAREHGFSVGDSVEILLDGPKETVPDLGALRVRRSHRSARGHLRRVRPRDRAASVRRTRARRRSERPGASPAWITGSSRPASSSDSAPCSRCRPRACSRPIAAVTSVTSSRC